MIGLRWFDRFRRAPAPGLPEGARVAITRHPVAILLQPYLRNIRGDRIVSTHAMPRAAWSVIPSDSDDAALGAALLAAFGRVRPGENPKFDRNAPVSYTDVIREVLGLPDRTPLWKGTLGVTADVSGGAVRFAALFADGVPGGFAGFTPPREVVCATPGDVALLGRGLQEAFALTQQP
jgi:hypothetical protein